MEVEIPDAQVQALRRFIPRWQTILGIAAERGFEPSACGKCPFYKLMVSKTFVTWDDLFKVSKP